MKQITFSDSFFNEHPFLYWCSFLSLTGYWYSKVLIILTHVGRNIPVHRCCIHQRLLSFKVCMTSNCYRNTLLFCLYSLPTGTHSSLTTLCCPFQFAYILDIYNFQRFFLYSDKENRIGNWEWNNTKHLPQLNTSVIINFNFKGRNNLNEHKMWFLIYRNKLYVHHSLWIPISKHFFYLFFKNRINCIYSRKRS